MADEEGAAVFREAGEVGLVAVVVAMAVVASPLEVEDIEAVTGAVGEGEATRLTRQRLNGRDGKREQVDVAGIMMHGAELFLRVAIEVS